MTFEDGRFDAVAMANTLSYADDTRVALAGVARVLKPGGRFAFSATYDPDGTRWKEDKVDAGAKLVQIYSGFIYRGPDLVSEVADTLAIMLRKKNL